MKDEVNTHEKLQMSNWNSAELAKNGSAGGWGWNGSGSIVGREHPSLDLSQKVEVAYQLLFFALGTPINVWGLRVQKRRRSGLGKSRLAALGTHLMVANLLVLLLHCLVRTAWMLAYFWPAGDALCRLWSAAANGAFHLVSNVVVALALDMLFCVRYPLRAQTEGRVLQRRLAAGAWALAALCAMPQLALRGTVTVPGFEPAEQCYIVYYHRPDVYRVHAIFDALTVFYLPLLIIVCVYSLIGSQIKLHVASGRRLRRSGRPQRSSAETLKYRTLVGDLLVVRLTALHDHRLHTALRDRFPYHRSPSSPAPSHPCPVQIQEEGEGEAEGEWSSLVDCGSEVTVHSAAPFRPTVQSCSTSPYPNGLGLQLLEKRKSLSMVDMGELEGLRSQAVRKSAIQPPLLRSTTRARRRQSRGVLLKRRVLRSSLVVVLTYFVSWLPYQILTLWRLLCGSGAGCAERLSAYEWLEALQLASACISPFVYGLDGPCLHRRSSSHRHPPPSTSAVFRHQTSLPTPPATDSSPLPPRKRNVFSRLPLKKNSTPLPSYL